ncbi:MAG: beta-hydroxyacyl-ACP dehydratase [Candidatus Omnitrophota bacterium]|jgi:3-hydroxyacyl-[acyl-carrier-protein] dehydratase|nr:MAG: beta-hydroxyacyl-ACP dehydratase [Candidatus Omnitrophota bacterium]
MPLKNEAPRDKARGFLERNTERTHSIRTLKGTVLLPRTHKISRSLNPEDLLPQKRPFIFVDKILGYERSKKIVALKHLRKNSFFLKGHFPGNPIMPGALIVEAMGQASIMLFYLSNPSFSPHSCNHYLVKVEATFLFPIRPKEDIVLESKITHSTGESAIFDTCARVGSKIASTAKIYLVIKKKNHGAK